MTVALAALTNCDGLLSSHYTVHIVLDRANGLEENSEVKANDLLVGRVAGIKLHPKGVVVEANIKNEAQLTKGNTAQVIT
ncbi:MAG TPA: MlaD family protein, partial [Chitinophagales bacterium]|nr:MlaD family protein [Chitinophagales bacterium]